MSDLSKAVVRSGAVDADMLAELSHWKLPVSVPEDPPFNSAEEAVTAIEEAQDDFTQVEVRVTDPAILKQYEATKQTGRLKIVASETEERTFGWEYGRTLLGEYILPWTSSVSTDLLVNGASFLLNQDKQRVYFTNTQDIYVGDEKKFVVCTPRK